MKLYVIVNKRREGYDGSIAVAFGHFYGLSLCKPDDCFNVDLGIAIASIKAREAFVEDLGQLWLKRFCGCRDIRVYTMPDKAITSLMHARERYVRSNGHKHMAVEGIGKWLLGEWGHPRTEEQDVRTRV